MDRNTGPNRLPVKAIFSSGGHLNLHDSEHHLIIRALEETNGNVTEAAKKLGISRRTLHRKLHLQKSLSDKHNIPDNQ